MKQLPNPFNNLRIQKQPQRQTRLDGYRDVSDLARLSGLKRGMFIKHDLYDDIMNGRLPTMSQIIEDFKSEMRLQPGNGHRVEIEGRVLHMTTCPAGPLMKTVYLLRYEEKRGLNGIEKKAQRPDSTSDVPI